MIFSIKVEFSEQYCLRHAELAYLQRASNHPLFSAKMQVLQLHNFSEFLIICVTATDTLTDVANTVTLKLP